ncbi:MAG TPA: hypothetical protein VIF38_03280 [Burkholderiales bacterium]|jgi:hypothetical protein
MNPLAKLCLAASAAAFCAQAAAQGMHKCKDAAGKITYTGSECQLLGLTPAGEVAGRANVTPALKFPAQPAAAPAAEEPPAPAPAQASGDASSDPQRRCFSVKSGKGTSTRCNDAPE